MPRLLGGAAHSRLVSFLGVIETISQVLVLMIPNVSPRETRRPEAVVNRWLSGTVAAIGLAGTAFFAALGCGAAATAEPEERLSVVTTTALLADLVKNVGGDQIEVRSIVPAGVDVHAFQTTPGDSLAISRADVIVSNGSGLDAFLEPVLRSAKSEEAVLVVAAQGLDEQGSEQQSLKGDPHFWQNPIFAIHYVERIRDGLMKADADNAVAYQANAEAYIRQLRQLDGEIARILSQVPTQRRRLVTFHDAFGNFVDRYGWQATAFVSGDASQVTPGAIVAAMERVREEGVPAFFAEPQFRSDLIEQAAREAGVVVGAIYSDVLDDKVTTYLDMMRFNARSLAEHLE